MSQGRHGETAASESAAAQSSAATQLSAEAALARAAVRGEQSEGRVEERAITNKTSTGAMGNADAPRSERAPPPAWHAGGERERCRADERSDAA